VNLAAHVDSILTHHSKTPVRSLPDSVMRFRASAGGLHICICAWTIDAWRHEEKTRINSLEAVVLYSLDLRE
jgi:hypothetical protein